MAIPRMYRWLGERLIAMSFVDGECWVWMGKRGAGRNGEYPQINLYCRAQGKTVTKKAYRVSYETFVGPIPEGHEIDHKCSNTLCINPNHLEPVSRIENERRKRAAS